MSLNSSSNFEKKNGPFAMVLLPWRLEGLEEIGAYHETSLFSDHLNLHNITLNFQHFPSIFVFIYFLPTYFQWVD